MMPGMSGVETLQVIQERSLATNTPIICLTADAIKGARENYMRMGFTDYFTKPIIYTDLEELLYKYIPKDMMVERTVEDVSDNDNKPSMLIVNEDPEKLRELREMLKTSFKVIIVRDDDAAEKFLSSHTVDYIMKGGN